MQLHKLFLSKCKIYLSSIILRNTSWLLLDQILRIIFAILVGSWTARYLGAGDFGRLTFVLSFLTIFQIISGLGSDGIVVREFIHNSTATKRLLGSVFYSRIVLGSICWIVSVLIYIFVYGINDPGVKLVVIAGVSLVFQSVSIIELWFQSNNKSINIVIPKIVSSIIINSLKIVFIINGMPIYYFALLYSVDFLIAGLLMFYFYYKFYDIGKWVFDYNTIKNIIKDSFPFLVSAISIFLYTRIDTFIIKKYLHAEELGVYTAAITISTMLPMLPMLLQNVLLPLFAKYKNENTLEYNKKLMLLFKYFGIAGLIISIFFYFIADYIVFILFGSEYSKSAEILRIHVFTNIFIYLGIAQNISIINENKGRVNIYKTSVGILCSFTFNLFLIPRYGIIGAAYSAVLVQFISSILVNIIIDREVFKLQTISYFNS